MTLTDVAIVEALRAYAQKRSNFDVEKETANLKRLQGQPEVAKFLENYRFLSFASAGGSGIVFKVEYIPHKTERALKVPRASLMEELEAPEENPEVDALEKISHEHVVRLYEACKVKAGRHLMVSEWVPQSLDLDKYVQRLCSEIERNPQDHQINKVLDVLARLIKDTSAALRYLHERFQIFHFDVKPANILVNTSRPEVPQAYLTDFGFAREKPRYKPEEKLQVGFTWRYAHPELAEPIRGRISQTQAKAKHDVRAGDIDARFDLFAFGRTIQECLKIVQRTFRDKAASLYCYEYLHTVACLCLDGKGATTRPTEDLDFVVEDAASGLPLDLFNKQRFRTVAEVENALDRLLGFYRIEHEIPELDPWYGSTINASDVAQINLTPRLRRLITHPLFKRLEKEAQLGMLQEVFPTATHSRGNHSLGVYGAACRYISALYWDPENPVCRILLKVQDVKALLVAALLHDLGQTAFGHDIEEIDDRLFSHTEFTRRLFKVAEEEEKTLGASLAKIIADPEPAGWGLPDTAATLRYIRRERVLPIDHLLTDIVDGPLDADKLDYLVRDSVDCRVQYGHGIDAERFLRSLTVVSEGGVPDDPRCRLRLGIKAKGKASADAFAVARAQLYQALYWHHTFRAIKAMFLTAAAYALNYYEDEGGQTGQARLEQDVGGFLQNLYFEYVFLRPLGIRKPSQPLPELKKKKGKGGSGDSSEISLQEILAAGLSQEPQLKGLGGTPVDRTLGFFYQIGPSNTKELLKSLVDRRLFKRLIEVPLSTVDTDAQERLMRSLRDAKSRAKLTQAFEDEFRRALTAGLQRASQTQESLKPDQGQQLLIDAWSDGASIAIDAPLRELGRTQRPPKIASDYKRKYSHETRSLPESTQSALWGENVPKLMRESAYLRIFVKPEVHDLMLRFIPYPERKDIFDKILGLRS